MPVAIELIIYNDHVRLVYMYVGKRTSKRYKSKAAAEASISKSHAKVPIIVTQRRQS